MKIIFVNREAFSTWFISKKFTTVPKANVDTRIVIVGASRTTMAFLNALLFRYVLKYPKAIILVLLCHLT